MVSNDFVYIIRARIIDFNCFPVKNYLRWFISIQMFILSLTKYLPILIVDNLQKGVE